MSASRKPLTYHSTEGSLGNPKTLILETGSHKLKHTDSQGVPLKDPKRQASHKNSLGSTSGCTKPATSPCPGHASHTMGIPKVVGPSHSAFLLISFSRSPESPLKSSSSWLFTVLVWFAEDVSVFIEILGKKSQCPKTHGRSSGFAPRSIGHSGKNGMVLNYFFLSPFLPFQNEKILFPSLNSK